MKKDKTKKPKSQARQSKFSDQKKPLDPQSGKYFFYPNEYKDALCRIRIPGRAKQILDIIERFTLGFNKREAKISFKTFRKRTGMDDRNFCRARKILLKMGIISTVKKDSEKRIYYRIQMDYTKWKALSKKTVMASLSKKTVKGTVIKDSKALSKKTVPIFIKDTLLNTFILKTDKPAKIIEELKTRKKDLEEDLKKKGSYENKQYLIEGIEKIDKLLIQLKNQTSKKLKKNKK
ncbi:hypothetical protein ES703_51188 [subsurface metagenome]